MHLLYFGINESKKLQFYAKFINKFITNMFSVYGYARDLFEKSVISFET